MAKLEWAAKGVHSHVLKMLPKKKLKILDAGSGRGIMSRRLAKLGHDVYSLDMENNSPFKINFKKGDLNKKLPYKDNFFDCFLLVEVIEHLENPRHIIKEIKRTLKKGGFSIITTPNITHWKARLKFLFRGEVWGFSKPEYERTGHIDIITLLDLKRICKEENLKILEIKYNDSKRAIFGDILILKIQK